MRPNLTFQGIEKHYVTVMEKKRPYKAPRTLNILRVPGRPGGYLSDIETDVLIIPVTFLVEGETRAVLRKNAEDFAAWLTTDKPEPLVFNDEPDRTYFAVTEGSIDPDELVIYGTVEVSFVCPDPHKYGMTRTLNFTSDTHVVHNKGTADAIPIFRGTVNQKITNLDIVTLDAYMRIGAPAPISVTPTDKRSQILSDELSTLSGWAVATEVDNGHVEGNMITDGNGFLAETWGPVQSPAGWQGPSVIKGLPQTVQDFEAEVMVEQISGLEQVGMIEIYFRDAQGGIVCKLGVSDEWKNTKMNQVKLQLGDIGGRASMNRTADNPAHWNNFRGMLRVQRTGKRFTGYFALVDSNGKHHTRSTIPFFDSFDNWQQPVASVQIAIRKWPDGQVDATTMRVNKLQVWALHSSAPAETVYIAEAGDTIEINHEIGDVLINGEPRLWAKDFGSKFFRLKPGENFISLSPYFAVDMEMTWRDRFL